MNELLIEKVLSTLGFLCFEYHAKGYFSVIGEPPRWSLQLLPCVRNRFPKILPIDISPFLDNFMVDSVSFWAQDGGSILRSGYWTQPQPEGFFNSRYSEATSAEDVNLEALVLSVEGRRLLLLEASDGRFSEAQKWLQLARAERLDSMVAQKASASQMTSLTLFDAVTGLCNQQSFLIQLSQWLEQMKRGLIGDFVVARLGIDRFSALHFSQGDVAINQCLVQMARRIKDYVGAQDVLARVGDGEFALMVRTPEGLSQESWIEGLVGYLQQPYRSERRSLHLTVSAGMEHVSSLPRPASWDVEQCLCHVSMALRQAHDLGRGQWVTFDPQSCDRDLAVLNQEQKLLAALGGQTLMPLFRPVFSDLALQLVGVELCLAWPQDHGNDIAAVQLERIARDRGLLHRLSVYRLEQCLVFLRTCEQRKPLTFLLRASIHSFCNTQFMRLLVTLEQTLADGDQAIVRLTELDAKGLEHRICASLEQLDTRTIKLAVEFDALRNALNADCLPPVLLDLIEGITIDLANFPGGGPIDLAPSWPDLLAHQKQGRMVIAENINSCRIYDQAIASGAVDLFSGSHLSESLSRKAFLNLLAQSEGP
ncbi:MAG: diguanylate cyclase [Cyanobacteria bacterium P01_F01_bin.42]